MKPVKIVIEKHPDGYVAYPVGIKGVVVGQEGIDKADILSQIRQEWYCTSPPSEGVPHMSRKTSLKNS